MSSTSIQSDEDPVTERKKQYMSERQIPALFEALMAGLMNYEPDNHYDFLIQSLAKMKQQSNEPIRWDTFIRMHENQK